MLKALGFILIIASSTMLGFYYGDKFKRRVRQLKELQQGIYVLKNEINFTRSLLPDAFYKAYEKSSGPVAKIFYFISERLNSGEEVEMYSCIKDAVDENKDRLDLKKEDIEIIYDLGRCLGDMDVEGHNDILGLAIENLDKSVKNAELNLDKNVKMYRYLGFSLGAMIGIILL